MPNRDKQAYNQYLNQYMKQRWVRRRAAAIEQLGGACRACGTKDDLHFHHIDPSTKSMTIARASSASEKRFQEEIAKCELLCGDCHRQHHSAL